MNSELTNLTPQPQMEPLTLSLLSRFFGVPLLIIVLIVAGAITVVILFGARASPAPRSLESLLQAAEADAGLKNMGMLLPPDKEYWQTNLELAERIEKQEFTDAELKSIAERLAAVIAVELAKLGQQLPTTDDASGYSAASSIKLEFLIRAIGKTNRPEAVAPLVDVLATKRTPFMNVAIQQLGDLHQLPESRAAVPAIAALLMSPGEAETRMMASVALSVLAAPNDPEAISVLNAVRLAEEGEVAWNAALALARLGSLVGKSTLLDLLDREFWEEGERYQVTDEKNQVRRFAMPPQRVDDLLIAAMNAAVYLDDSDLWALIERLGSDKSLNVKARALDILSRRDKAAIGADDFGLVRRKERTMPTKEMVTRVWIEPGCIVCDACETTCPEVFEVLDDTCIVRPAALNVEFTKPLTESIKDAAAECPVDVIKYELVPVEVSEAEFAASAAAPVPAVAASVPSTVIASTAPAKAAHAPAVAKPAAPAAATAAAVSVKTSVAGQPDPSIQALLRAATSRGGNATIVRKGVSLPDDADQWQSKDPSQLPPDARQARIMDAAKKAKQDPDQQRRAFVGTAALAVGWVAFGGSVGVSIGPAFGRFMMPNVLEEPDPRVRVGKLQRYVEMAPGDVNEDYKPQGIWLIREEERIAALNIICTHLGCIPNWLPNDKKFKCPCHGSGYKQDGINFEGPTPRPLERFRISVVDGILIVDKSKKFQYELGQWEQPGSFIAV